MGVFGGSTKSSVSTTQTHYDNKQDNKQDNRVYHDERKTTDSRRFVDRRSSVVDNTSLASGAINSSGPVNITDGGISELAFNFVEKAHNNMSQNLSKVLEGQQDISSDVLANTSGTLAMRSQGNFLKMVGIIGAVVVALGFVILAFMWSR